MKITKSSIWQFFVFHVFLLFYYVTFPNKDSWIVTGILLLFVALLVVLEYLRTYLFVSPVMVWYVFWLAVISVGRMDLGLYPFYQVWNESLLKLVTLNTAVFYWVYWGAEFCLSAKRETDSPKVNYGRLYNIVVLCIMFSCLAFILNVLDTGVIPQLTGDANSYRESFVQNKYYKIVNILRFSLALVPCTVRHTDSHKKKRLLILLTAVFMFLEMLSGWRTYTLQGLILLLTGWFLTGETKSFASRRKNVRILIVFGIIAVCFIGYIAVTRDGVSGAIGEKISYLFYTLYMYIAPNFLNLQSAMETVEPVGLPVYSAMAITSFMPNYTDILLQYGEIDQAIGTFNVSTYMLQPWGDYGTAGTVFWTAIIAGISGASFSLNRKRGSLFSLVVLGLMNITIFISHNNLFLRTKSIVIWLIFGLFIDCITKDRSVAGHELSAASK